MGARLTKIYTRTGDRGETGLVGGRRLGKDAERIEAYGTVDELNSAIGLARSCNRSSPASNQRLATILAGWQNDLFNLGAELATLPQDQRAGQPRVGAAQITAFEHLIDELNAELGPLKEFILPGGSPVGAALHLARTICRRAERHCVRLARQESLGEFVVPYLNRLSDALFVLARWANHLQGVREDYWQKPTAE